MHHRRRRELHHLNHTFLRDAAAAEGAWLEWKMCYWRVTRQILSHVCASAVPPCCLCGNILQEWAHVRVRAASLLCELHSEASGSEKMAPFPVAAALHFTPVPEQLWPEKRNVQQSLFQRRSQSQSWRSNQQRVNTTAEKRGFLHGNKDGGNQQHAQQSLSDFCLAGNLIIAPLWCCYHHHAAIITILISFVVRIDISIKKKHLEEK